MSRDDDLDRLAGTTDGLDIAQEESGCPGEYPPVYWRAVAPLASLHASGPLWPHVRVVSGACDAQSMPHTESLEALVYQYLHLTLEQHEDSTADPLCSGQISQ